MKALALTTTETLDRRSPEAAPVPALRAVTPSRAKRAAGEEQLALYGGRPAVTVPYRERWRQIPLRAKLRILKRMHEDTSTHDGRGYEVLELERRFAQMTGVEHALAMNSGTATLHSAYLALGVGPGDEVLVPSYTFFASVAPILQCGARPVFCEIDPQTLTIDPDDVAKRITSRTRAICAVHIWGNPAQMDRLRTVADDAGVGLIEDCSHAHGAKYGGRCVGSWGHIGCFSLQGAKAVSGGEAGIAVTSDATLFDRMLALGHYPRPATDQRAVTLPIGPYTLGLKYRPHLYAVILAQESLEQLSELNRLRHRNLEILSEELAGCAAVRPLERYDGAERGGFLEFVFRYDPARAGGWNAGAFCCAARAEGAPLKADRYEPLHLRPPFSGVDLSGFGGALRQVSWQEPPSLPKTESACKSIVSFPAFAEVSEKFLRQCAGAIHKVSRLAPTVTDFRVGR